MDQAKIFTKWKIRYLLNGCEKFKPKNQRKHYAICVMDYSLA